MSRSTCFFRGARDALRRTARVTGTTIFDSDIRFRLAFLVRDWGHSAHFSVRRSQSHLYNSEIPIRQNGDILSSAFSSHKNCGSEPYGLSLRKHNDRGHELGPGREDGASCQESQARIPRRVLPLGVFRLLSLRYFVFGAPR